jgi:hypothetical protein
VLPLQQVTIQHEDLSSSLLPLKSGQVDCNTVLHVNSERHSGTGNSRTET